ncbi:FtsX-like permease family protein [Auraticoccus monumenti]|uniref:FtsX-like permease family protein n=1 Tax=Auraticoccus monumenti TaxID=675864 RepID=A0A1G7A8S9_9ACTN|nr:FtsX-like permease family protein [Auraticoccus monumenti]SDE10465.1 hypothetical protein SAMN04489747_2525 [Auraticoccus monumenti]
MSIAVTLAPRLAIARLRGARGGAVLDVLAVAAFTVSAFLALTVAGGTWMFVQRWQHPTAATLAAFDLDAPAAARVLEGYVILAAVACALLVVPVLNLGAAAARLGARGRARRLASLRLIGMTGPEVVTMSVIETLVQAAAGTALGSVLWTISLPAWQVVTFQEQPVAAGELLLPWWVVLALVAALLSLGALSAAVGLRRVHISPLGVALQQTPRSLRLWRLGAFALALTAFAVFSRFFRVGTLELGIYVFFAAMVLLVVGAVNLVGPWILQLLARPFARTASVPRLIAMRRIVDDPRGAWRNVSAVALLGTVSAYAAIVPTDPAALGDDPRDLTAVTDLRTGVLIALAVGLVVAAVSTLVNQAATVVDRAEESVAMDRAGVPRPVLDAVRRYHVLAPLVFTLAVSVGVGFLLVTPFTGMFGIQASGVLLVLLTVVVGLLLTLGVAEACRPLQRAVLAQTSRRND